jgi:ribulose-5-phosphate 4-epimerase/fuculose-1-phosphate aldolase
VKTQIAKYAAKLAADGSTRPDRIAFLAKDDILLAQGAADLAERGADILSRLNVVALVAAQPVLPVADLLVRRAAGDAPALIPRDTETRTFLHDIPFVRRENSALPGPDRLARLLSQRKGIVVEGVGIIAVGTLTPEQAYINYASVFHAVMVKYLADLLRDGFQLPGEEAAFDELRREWLRPINTAGLIFGTHPLPDRSAVLAEIAQVGRYTVQKRLVDSSFGNISWREGNTLYISQTGTHLDELEGLIDPVPDDNSSTAGVTASSELIAHRRIVQATGARAVLHGHPKVAVVMSMQCEEENCAIDDCWRRCPKVRYLAEIPIVAGEIGAGGLAEKVAPVIGDTDRALVYGHGVFTIGRNGFREAFAALVEVENWCRKEYLRRLAARRKKIRR